MRGHVKVEARPGGEFAIVLEPPFLGMARENREPTYSGAIGFATEQALALDRIVIDETGQLDRAQLHLLLAVYAIDQLPENLAKLAQLAAAQQ